MEQELEIQDQVEMVALVVEEVDLQVQVIVVQERVIRLLLLFLKGIQEVLVVHQVLVVEEVVLLPQEVQEVQEELALLLQI